MGLDSPASMALICANTLGLHIVEISHLRDIEHKTLKTG